SRPPLLPQRSWLAPNYHFKLWRTVRHENRAVNITNRTTPYIYAHKQAQYALILTSLHRSAMSRSSQEAGGDVRRDLQSRHLAMIAIGGSIGTGLFVASGATIAEAGPGGALLSYALVGLMVYFLMTSLGELAAYMPVSGSFATYGARYVDPAFGFALG